MAGPHDHLIPRYVDYIRDRSNLATQEHYGALELAAHLFAVAQQLVEDGHDLEPREEEKTLPEENVASLEELGAILAQLPQEISARDLYRLLTAALSLVEAKLCVKTDEDYERTVKIDELRVGEERCLGGRVTFWVRKPRIFRTLRLETFEEFRKAGASLPPSALEHPGKHLDRLFCHWRRGHARPSVVRATPPDDRAPLVLEGGRELASGAPFRIALCPLVGKAHPRFVLTEDRRSFRTCKQAPMVEPAGHTVREQLKVILELADREEIHLVVLPELSVDAASRDWLIEALRTSHSNLPFGVVAGSFHFDKAESSRPYNESRFVDGAGRKLLEHQKRGRFRITRKQLEKCLDLGLFRNPERLRAKLSTLPQEIDEHIEPGTRIELLETAVGQMAVLICADAVDEPNRRELRDAVIQLRPDFVLLPSMSPETDRFDEFATSMERLGVATFFVNAHCICPEGQTLAAVCLDLYRGPDDPPTRVRWRRGHGIEEWIRRALPGDDGPWKRLEPLGPAFDWLDDREGKHLGLVVDLGAYWRQAEGKGKGKGGSVVDIGTFRRRGIEEP